MRTYANRCPSEKSEPSASSVAFSDVATAPISFGGRCHSRVGGRSTRSSKRTTLTKTISARATSPCVQSFAHPTHRSVPLVEQTVDEIVVVDEHVGPVGGDLLDALGPRHLARERRPLEHRCGI